MIIDCVSDLHGYYPDLEGGDLLIVAGDLTATDKVDEYLNFLSWCDRQKYSRVVVVGGNHDNHLINEGPFFENMVHYLSDSGTEFEGIKIWGSPWTSQFPGINPRCCAFTRPFMVSLNDRWDMIPDDTDILVTHMPPLGFFDMVSIEYDASVGDVDLRKQVMDRIKPKLHVFGHIHEWGGHMVDTNVTKFVNCSIMNENYKPVNKPVRVIW